MKGLLSHTIDFEILDTNSLKTIIFLDSSQYFETPTSPILQITFPGQSRFFLVAIEFGRINNLTSHTIGYSDILEDERLKDFPDGVYEFTYKICPYDYLFKTKYILRTTNLDKYIQKIYFDNDAESCILTNKAFKNDLVDIHILLESAKANAALNNLSKATKDFALAQEKVNKLIDQLKSK